MLFVTGNQQKINEFRAAGLKFSGTAKKDIPEVESENALVVALYKSLDAGPDTIIEDSSLIIGGLGLSCPLIGPNFKYEIKNLHRFHRRKATMVVCLAWNFGDIIEVYTGSVLGLIDAPLSLAEVRQSEPGLSAPDFFDRSFYPLDQLDRRSLPLAALKGQPQFDPRIKAVRASSPELTQRTESIRPWKGSYQPS